MRQTYLGTEPPSGRDPAMQMPLIPADGMMSSNPSSDVSAALERSISCSVTQEAMHKQPTERGEDVQRPQKQHPSSPERSMRMRRFQETICLCEPTGWVILWPDPEKALRRTHTAVVSAVTPEAPAVTSNTAVGILNVAFLATRSAFVCSDPDKVISIDPALVGPPLLWLVAPVPAAYAQV